MYRRRNLSHLDLSGSSRLVHAGTWDGQSVRDRQPWSARGAGCNRVAVVKRHLNTRCKGHCVAAHLWMDMTQVCQDSRNILQSSTPSWESTWFGRRAEQAPRPANRTGSSQWRLPARSGPVATSLFSCSLERHTANADTAAIIVTVYRNTREMCSTSEKIVKESKLRLQRDNTQRAAGGECVN